MAEKNRAVNADTLARWEVSLTVWEWPDDLLGKPLTGDERQAIRGAWAVVHILADQDLVESKWAERTRLNREAARAAKVKR